VRERCQITNSSSVSTAWRQLTLWSPRSRCMGTTETRLSHGGRCCHSSRCCRLVRPCRVPVVIEADNAATNARAGADCCVKRPVTRRWVTCTQQIYRQHAHKATKPRTKCCMVDLFCTIIAFICCHQASHARCLTRTALDCGCLFIRNRHTITMTGRDARVPSSRSKQAPIYCRRPGSEKTDGGEWDSSLPC